MFPRLMRQVGLPPQAERKAGWEISLPERHRLLGIGFTAGMTATALGPVRRRLPGCIQAKA